MTHTALILKQQWLNRLIDPTQPKTWEIRGSNTKKRGVVYFIASGANCVTGVALLVDSFPLTQELFEENMGKHQTADWDWDSIAGRYKLQASPRLGVHGQ